MAKKGSKRARQRSNQSADRNRNTVRKANVSGNKKSKPGTPRGKSGGRAWQLLIVCVAILAIGFAVRFYYQNIRTSQLDDLKAAVARAQMAQDWNAVEVAARAWAEEEPDNFEPIYISAVAAYATHRYAEAEAYLKLLPDSAPPNTFQMLAAVQMEGLNHPFDAAETSRRASELYPAETSAHESLIYFYAMTCQRSKLLAEARRAMDSGAATVRTYVHLVAANWILYTDGTERCRYWLKDDPDNELIEVASVVHLAASPELVEQRAPVQYHLDQVMKLREKYPENIELLAVVLAQACEDGDVEAVQNLLGTAPVESQDDARFWRFKGWYHVQKEEWDQARSSLMNALEIDPFDWKSQFEMAAIIRQDEGLDAAKELQTQADAGKQLQYDILGARFLESLSDRDLLDSLESYIRLCGQSEVAEGLREQLSEKAP